MSRTRLAAAVALGLIGGLVGAVSTEIPASAAGPIVFTNAGAITIPDSGPATPYPSTIQVSGLTTAITDVNVTLTGYSHTCPFDVAALLVAPTGQQTLLMADLGPGLGCPDATSANLTFDDAAATAVPYPPTTGTWKPTDGEPAGDNNFPAPAPAGGAHPTSLAAFNGLAGNGTWSLYVIDENGGDTGTISGGWNLSITTAPDTTPPDTVITKAPPKKSAKRHVKIYFSSTEPGSTFRCSLDGATPVPCTSPAKYRRLKVGRHKFSVYAIDAAGNADATPARVRFRVKHKR